MKGSTGILRGMIGRDKEQWPDAPPGRRKCTAPICPSQTIWSRPGHRVPTVEGVEMMLELVLWSLPFALTPLLLLALNLIGKVITDRGDGMDFHTTQPCIEIEPGPS